jgi:hypothetical protein
MKTLILLVTLLASSFAFSESQLNFGLEECSNYSGYVNTGWKIHSPSKFNKLERKFSKSLKRGLADGSIIDDMTGTIRTTDTLSNNALILRATSWDALNTPQNLMYGDYAAYAIFGNETTLAEIRWFDGKNRNIVINPTLLKCFSEGAPLVDNSVM